MKRNCIVLATILAALMLAWPGHAQDKPQPTAPAEETSPNSAPEKLLNLDFPGGSAADYVSAIRKTAADANIIVISDISSVPFPAVQLRNVDIQSALNVLNSIHQAQSGRAVEVRVGADMPPTRNKPGSMERPVFTVSAQFGGLADGARDSVVLDISDILSPVNNAPASSQTAAADVLTAIETASQMLQGEFQPAQIKFHEATGLLIARGHPEQIGTIQRVVQQLQSKRERMRQRAREADAAKAEAQQLGELTRERDQMRNELENLARQSAEWKTKFDVMQSELEQARKALQDREHDILMLQRQVQDVARERDQKKP